MKKLIIAMAIASFAIFANAASVDWAATYVMQPGTTSMANGYYGVLFAAEDITVADLSAKLSNGDFSSIATYGMNAKTSNVTGSYATTGWAEKTAGSYTFYAVIFDANTTASAKNFYVTSTKTETLLDGTGNETTVAFGNLAASTMTAGNWTAINVPEPTSGLLLLVGMAGLALRRKWA